MTIKPAELANKNPYLLRNLALYGTCFFFITVLLTAFVIAPKINSVFESQRSSDIQIELALEAQLFTRFVESQHSILRDLAGYPSIVNSVMLSNTNEPMLIDLFENVAIGGKSGRVILQDIAGNVLIQSATDLQGSYGIKQLWFERILNADIPYYFRLLKQTGKQFTFQISTPVTYNNFVEGVLSAEFSMPLDQVFIALSFGKHIAFKLSQDHISINTDSSHIDIAREDSLTLTSPAVTFTYISDDALVRNKKRALRNTILLVLLVGLGISFLLFSLYGYRNLIVKHTKIRVRPSLNRVYLTPFIVAVVGVAASTTAFLIINNLHQVSVEEQQIASSRAAITSIRERISGNLEILESTKAFFDASDTVERAAFKTFVTPLLANHSNIKAVAWLPKVTLDQRREYINSAQLDGLKNYNFRELSPTREIVVAGIRSAYYPVFFAEPLLGNETAFGFDLASNSRRFSALIEAGNSGDKVATAPINLVDDKITGSGILVFYPVYNSLAQSSNDSLASVKGYVQLVLRTSSLVAQTLENTNDVQSLYIRDITDEDKPETIYGTAISAEHTVFSESIDVAGRTWRMDVVGMRAEESLNWVPWLVLVSGLTFVAFTTAGLIQLIRRREVVERLVTERTAELRMLSSIVANSNDIFIVTEADDIDAENNGPRIIYVNEAFTRLTGYSYDEVIGRSPRILQGAKTDRQELNRIRLALEQGKPFVGELLNYTKSGKELWIDINIAPIIDIHGRIIQFVAVQRDITERRQAQVDREKLINELTGSNEELERFAFVCSHDLQEPLRMIRSFSEKLQLHIASDLERDEKGKRYFKFITDGATRAQDLIADILTYSSINNDVDKLQAINTQDLVDNVKRTLQEEFLAGGMRISSDILPTSHGNQTQLYQLFQNLINNAVKYRRADVTLKVHIGVIDADNYWQFSVKDNGIGMEQRHLGKIFDVFQRLHGKSQYAGTGVGLSICKKVVTRHGGTLWVESDVGVGSTFHFTLPKPIPIEIEDETQRKAS